MFGSVKHLLISVKHWLFFCDKTQTAKNGGFFEELLSENDFEAVLVNFGCYEYGANASEAVQKISTKILLRVSHSGRKHHYNFFRTPSPRQN